jgi:hypothetical protein
VPHLSLLSFQSILDIRDRRQNGNIIFKSNKSLVELI